MRRVWSFAGSIPLPLAGTAALYALIDRLSARFEVQDGLTLFAPETAIAILGSMLFGARGVAGVFLGSLLSAAGELSAPASVFSASLNAMEGAIPWLVFRAVPHLSRRLRDLRSFFVFLLTGTIANTALTVALRRLLLAPADGEPLGWGGMLIPWVAHFTPALLIAAPLLAFGTRRRAEPEDLPSRRRTILTAVQIIAVILLVGWAASSLIRNTLINHLERGRLEHQEAVYRGSEMINQMHANFLGAARIWMRYMDAPEPDLEQEFLRARAANLRFLGELEPIVVQQGPPGLKAEFAAIRSETTAWFDQTAADLPGENATVEGSGSSHSLGRTLLGLRSSMLDANAESWRQFTDQRQRIMAVSLIADLLVFLILLACAAYLITHLARPLQLIHQGVVAMASGELFEAKKIQSELADVEELATTMEQTGRQLRQREADLTLQTERALEASRHKSEFLAKMSHELRT
ncbi:MAG TPA: hypothetical protein VM534_05000, partial [Thermoanaerobaculia bacterium]|nr:hypothetical protein [Thermoanaerobaculia bacterium]